MSSIDELREIRLKKLQLLKDSGINPYPTSSNRQYSLRQVVDKFEDLKNEKSIVLAGRIMALRTQGALAFCDLYDGTSKFQGLAKKDEVGEMAFSLFCDAVDMGDFVELEGSLFISKRGEKTLLAKKWTMLTKSLRPLPDKWEGLQDKEERLRLRYLDILTDNELQQLFIRKAKFWDVTRKFLKEKGFLEVETPTLEITTGGAEARPFKTHHNDFDIDLFLRISVGELWQKRLMSAGFPKTFEIGRVYRNEGTSPEHLQEFTNMEFYMAYADAKAGMELVKDLYRTIANEVYGKTKFSANGFQFDLNDEWQEIDYVSKTKEITGVDVLEAKNEEMIAKLKELGVNYTGTNRERLIDSLWKYCRKKIAGPAFLVNHPAIVAPLSKLNPSAPGRVSMFQPLIAGSEAGRGYSELNDPIDQRARFEEQQKLIDRGDEEAMMPDFEFVEMLEYGMPPACGFGFGERVFAFFEGKPIRETQLFPLMRPLGER
ncbi:MAG: lysine--tRNA ligase [Candidatus Taylorbacteria bacterium RIFCSPLOWO2_02_FULL_43_11]|uniref:Lysine--tRNA ligase n=1 Tax=Candidatus Taylorbacteria bacterium RIFCSPHIGHO2_02_FULL_43_32b TaxID=1802306 RepID=A0A1G2ML46_9BACT|nr:MAG: lysine--tRNA ligase [Candidatus Taylorbacteria bacterium RIFCSPHIGHO2_01_FULL_43_47]OHA24454.1 MAG: lysine--tRNA ligase [Candidatus Taylorbacteria bacterium RIFCSPHIGHO2_02_FULL_43_32b]OHA35354.1 MAG: lysine--tRNA ligase [Candidatus Taylorbacteria bacterium RIFCSPLOWO2_02_FULL_43_11]